MSTLHRLAFRVDIKNIPVWYEDTRPRNGTSRYKHRSMDRNGIVGGRGLGAE